MLTHLLAEIERLEQLLELVADGDKAAAGEARRSLRRLEILVADRFFVDADVEVEERHERAALEAVTAYLDGAVHSDDFQLLASVVGARITREGGDGRWVAGVIAALARLGGELAGRAEPGGEPDWERGLRVIQRIAAERGTAN
jgi:hypothetical protein